MKELYYKDYDIKARLRNFGDTEKRLRLVDAKCVGLGIPHDQYF